MSDSALQSLFRVFDSAKRASGNHVRFLPGVDAPRISSKPAVESGSLNLRELVVSASAADTSSSITYDNVPIVVQKSKSAPVAGIVIANSLVAAAGATIVVAAERNAAYSGTVPLFYRDAGIFRVVEAANFLDVADGDSATLQNNPWNQAAIAWADAPSVAFRTTISRRQQKDAGGEQIVENLLGSIIRGLSVAADRTLLGAVEAQATSSFSLAKAASRGLKFDELRAFVGQRGDNAQIDAAGTLRVEGIQAELTPSCERSIIGSFSRSAVAIHPDINVHFERLNAEGEMRCTVFASLVPLLPDGSAFWVAGDVA